MKKKIDYKALFGIGLIFTATGASLAIILNPIIGGGLLGLGIVMLITGARHRKEWKGKK